MDGLVPHFTVRDLDGSRVAYADIWQRRTRLLLQHAPGHAAADAVDDLRRRRAEIEGHAAMLVITTDEVSGLTPCAVLVADRWGEVHFAVQGRRPSELPSADELIDWLRYVQVQCPECQGEAR